MGRRIASESKQTVRGGPKPAKVGLHRRLICSKQIKFSFGYCLFVENICRPRLRIIAFRSAISCRPEISGVSRTG